MSSARRNRPLPRRPFLLAAVACSSALTGCSPQWANGTEPRTGPPTQGMAPDAADAKADPLAQYAAIPLGARVRAKRIRVLLVSVGDIAIYAHRPDQGAPTFTSVLRSYTSFKGNSVEGLDEFLDEVEAAYVLVPGEIESVRKFIHEAISDVDYYRVDVRQRVDDEHGAVVVYEFVEEDADRLLASRLITRQAALAVIHYTDSDGWDLDPNETFLASHYLVDERNGKLIVEAKKTR